MRSSLYPAAVALAVLLLPCISCDTADTPSSPDLSSGIPEAGRPVAGLLEAGGYGRAGWERYPLDDGNEWSYAGVLTVTIGDIATEEIYSENRVIDGTEELFGREYVIERHERYLSGCIEPDLSWIRYRQDKAGLYEADLSINIPPGQGPFAAPAGGRLPGRSPERWESVLKKALSSAGREERDRLEAAALDLRRKIDAVDGILRREQRVFSLAEGPPGGVLPDEITRLAYPLHPKQDWAIREEPLFASTVVRRDRVEVPAGIFAVWTIRIFLPAPDPGEEVVLWYGREGLIGMRSHLIGYDMITGATIIFDETLLLEEYGTVGRRASATGRREGISSR